MYALVDCNNFYCSCERVFDPSLDGRPVIVLSNNDGCAISRSEEAKALGIAMASPVFMMRKIIEKHRIAVFSSNYTLYGDMSQRIMGTLGSFSPHVEIYSIDEAFLDLRGMVYADLMSWGTEVVHTIGQHIGIPTSIGVGPTKTLAKMANRYAKKQFRKAPVFLAGNSSLTAELLGATAVGDIWGIGPRHALFLTRSGFKTAADLVKAPDDWVQKHLSVAGLRLLYELRGIATRAPELPGSVRKNICTSRSFGARIGDKDKLAEALANYAAACAAKLRADKTCCKMIQIFIQTNPHKTEESQYMRSADLEMERATNHSGEIIKTALRGLDLIFKSGYLYMKCGITAKDIVPESAVQTSCFDRTDFKRKVKIMETVDRINQTVGKESIRMAIQGFDRRYKLKAAHCSPKYTTRLDEILKIRI